MGYVLVVICNGINDIIAFSFEKQAAWSFSHNETDFFTWEKLDVMGERIVRNFSLEAYKAFACFLPSGMSIVGFGLSEYWCTLHMLFFFMLFPSFCFFFIFLL